MKDAADFPGKPATWRVGVDSGGTFTDVCMFDEASRKIDVWKVSSTPDDPSRGIARGVDEGMKECAGGDEATPAAAIAYLGHGTTVATNALITHRGARVGLLTTEGFRDLLEIGRQKRPDLYDLFAEKPPTLVPRELRFELPERMLSTGEVAKPLDESAVRKAARAMKAAEVEAVAICFLYAFVNPVHERMAGPSSKRKCPASSFAPATRSRRSSASSNGSRPRRSTPISGRSCTVTSAA